MPSFHTLKGKRGGSSTPVPMWKMKNSRSPSIQNDHSFKNLAPKGGEKNKDFSISARKLAATLWEIDRFPSTRVKMENLEDKISGVENVRKERILYSPKLDPFHSPISERMDPSEEGYHRRRASTGSQKLRQADCNLAGNTSLHTCLIQVDQMKSHGRSPCRHIVGVKNHLKDVHNGLTTSKELLKVLSRIFHLEEQHSTGLSLVSALKYELDRAYGHVKNLIQEQRTNSSDIDILLNRFEEEKVVWKIKEQDRIRSAITSIAGELQIEKRLRRQTERLNKKLGKELAETKESLSRSIKELESEKRTREILEQVSDELARGIGEDRAEVEELKRQSAKVREEVEKEREMLQLADVLREERVQMKLSEAKYQFEEKNALVDKLRSELEAYLKSKTGEEKGDGSPSYEKIKELEKYLRETLPNSYQHKDEEKKDMETVNKELEDDDDSADSDLHSIELNVDDINKSFQWGDAVKNDPKRNSVDTGKGRKSLSAKLKTPTIPPERKFANGLEWEYTNKQEYSAAFDRDGLFEFSSETWKTNVEDEIERYNMIKELRDHIVSSSRKGSSQDLQNSHSKDPNGAVREGLTVLQGAI
ncbi:uncharacterized protein At5g41620-like [Olea europaea var. sylvestris]|uniref:uncharacterized protein At5g41620-like n=1 Tax=Olea europaea var. sylvestris TaxID=158386 RepID=UPI000C1CEC0B|nr:uncharacterized protein At5g41620-like [Olea europaea var. sylvestris]